MGRKKSISNMPSYDELIIPTVDALIKLGGSGTIEEINNAVYELIGLSEEVIQIPHGEEGTTNEVDYRLAWSRTYLKKFGLIENSSRGIWALLKPNIDTSKLDYTQIVKAVKEQSKDSQPKTKESKKSLGQIE